VRGTSAVSLLFQGNGTVVLDGDNYTLDATVSELRD
jgi:autotransporter-associated beta strand protein